MKIGPVEIRLHTNQRTANQVAFDALAVLRTSAEFRELIARTSRSVVKDFQEEQREAQRVLDEEMREQDEPSSVSTTPEAGPPSGQAAGDLAAPAAAVRMGNVGV